MNERSKQLRRDSITLSREHGLYHLGGSFSSIEIMIALYDRVMTKDDVFILSKGHACAPLYVILREKGLNPKIEGHPSYDPTNGLHATTGSLGHGIPFGIGVAWGKKLRGESGNVYVLASEGDMQEGTFWESRLILNKNELKNIKIIIDINEIQGSNYVRAILPIPFWHLYANRIDGHDIEAISWAVKTDHVFTLAETIKGRGVSFMENKPEYGSHWLTDEEIKIAMEELK